MLGPHNALTTIQKMTTYHQVMDKNDPLEQHFRLCQEIYERLKREGTWSWPDSRNSDDMVESDDTSDNA